MSIMRVAAILSGWTGGPGLQQLYFRGATSSPVQADVNDVVARVRSFWAGVAGNHPVALTITVQQAVDVIDQATGNLEDARSATTAPLPVAGTGITEFYAPGIMGVLTMETGIIANGRRVRGRTYIGPLTEAAITNGTLGAGIVTNNLTFAAGLIAASPTTSRLVVWSRPKPGSPGVSRDVQTFAMNSKLAHLRTRRDN